MTIPLDEDSLNQAIYRAHYQAFIWNQCLSMEIPEINGWKTNDNTLIHLWFVGPQLPVSITKRKNSGYETDNKGKGGSKKKKTDKRPNRILGTREEVVMAPMDEEEQNDYTVNNSSNWEYLSEFLDSSDSSDSDWM